jgi:hypothetical protein
MTQLRQRCNGFPEIAYITQNMHSKFIETFSFGLILRVETPRIYDSVIARMSERLFCWSLVSRPLIMPKLQPVV